MFATHDTSSHNDSSHEGVESTVTGRAAGSSSSSTDQQALASLSLSQLWPPEFYEDWLTKLWMTYRHNYPPIRPSNYTTDIGWGCMLRSGQSLLANTLLIHFLHRDWRRRGRTDPHWKEYRRILQWFLDELSPRAPFSIHRIALLGKQLGKNIGEWFGPSTISQVILALVSDFPSAKLGVYVATDGVVYRDDVRDIATGKRPQGVFRSILILVSIRLGIDSLHPTYYPALKACFELPWFVGIAGGRPNSSLYFIGLQGDDLIYLDPHFSRPALETKHIEKYGEEDFSSYHCTIPRKLHISQVDPSMLLGFYCRTQAEFDAFCETITQIASQYTAIFTIEKRAPEYDEDVRSENDFGIVSDEEDEEEDAFADSD
ncbi:hypothetical protein BCR43DRAFT_443653 [Syncephalastrum racemosum]|uniref:Cysteine protease n=1 Tax=Syncephalastrum racemosum TaxID=13706 RepID=A0A1X2H6M9_SYNRA|nr:hypothetical protein BCR43DRAFT_443653 [Syncephalastrum racemosum]